MLKQLHIKNFQRHEDLTVDFDAITSIVGPTDSGKSSVIRALIWVMMNHPGGIEYIRDGADAADVSLTLESGKVVRRVRTKSKNLYYLDDQEFKAFGTGVPQPIEDELRVGWLNCQQQHDSPFWFSVSGTELARELNRIVDLSIIDDSHTYLASRVRDHQATIRKSEEHIDRLTKQVEENHWAVRADAALSKAHDRQSAYDQQSSKLSKLQTSLQRISASKRLADVALRAADVGDGALRVVSRYLTARDRLAGLLALCERLARAHRAASAEPPDFGHVLGLVRKHDELRGHLRSLTYALTNYVDAEAKANEKSKAFLALSKEFAAAEPIDLCVACGRPL